jgi:Ca2+-binding RTX toxin-like protein
MASIFNVILTGDQEVPVAAITEASGRGTVIWDPAANAAAYSITSFGLDFGPVLGLEPQTEDTQDDIVGMHVHNAARGSNGGVVFGQLHPEHDENDISFTLNADGSWTVRGIWETTDPAAQPITNFAATLTAALVGEDVPLYFNLHSVPFPSGEIRGQWVASGNAQQGTSGNDTITAPAGEAIVASGAGGDDSIAGGTLADSLSGGGGNDTLSGGDGDDSIAGGTGNDSINTGLGNDWIEGGSGNDTIGGMAGRDSVFGGRGDDLIAWNDPDGDVVNGGAGDDTIIGGNIAADTIEGGRGDDSITAFATSPNDATASDWLSGGAGDDTILGGDAADTLIGGTGDDLMSGGGGDDVFMFRRGQATGSDTISDFADGDVVQLSGFGAGFDPLLALTDLGTDTLLDLGDGDTVLFVGRTLAEFQAEDFVLG